MDTELLSRTAAAMVAKGKGLLAADESSGTCDKRFMTVGVESSELNRRTYRDLLFTAKGIEVSQRLWSDAPIVSDDEFKVVVIGFVQESLDNNFQQVKPIARRYDQRNLRPRSRGGTLNPPPPRESLETYDLCIWLGMRKVLY